MPLKTGAAKAASSPDDSTWPLSSRPGFLARRVHQIHVSLFSELCAPFGITPVQYSLLSALAYHEEADQTALARIVALDRTTTTGALTRLKARGLIRRKTSTTDRRSQNCALTANGRRILVDIEASARRAHAATVEMLDAREKKQFITLMTKIVGYHQDRQSRVNLL